MSTVVATLIVIMITLIAVAIIWTVTRGVIQRNSEGVTLSRFTIDLKIESVKIINNSINVKIKRNPGEGELKGITFVVFDGQNSQVIEKTNLTLNPLERKTFIIDYSGAIVKISVAPIFESSSGKLMTGSITDVYYITGFVNGTGGPGGGPGVNESNCTPDCEGKECGYDGCEGSCGSCTPPEIYCNNGICTDQSCTPDCSCA